MDNKTEEDNEPLPLKILLLMHSAHSINKKPWTCDYVSCKKMFELVKDIKDE